MSNYTNYQIVWQKWSDPLGEDDIENIKTFEPEFYDDEDKVVFDEDKAEPKTDFYERPTKVVITPMGIIPYTENTASNKIFNFWLGHTNFDITIRIGALIESIEGVETLDIFTRYRFRIGVGKLFDAPTVMNTIDKKIISFLDKQ